MIEHIGGNYGGEYFPAIKSALVDQPKAPNRHGGGLSGGIDGGLADKILNLIRTNNTITVVDISEVLETQVPTSM